MSSANERFAKTMEVRDLQTGIDLVASLSLADSEAAGARTNRFLDSLLRAPPDAEIYLCLLERLPPVVAAIAQELGKRFLGKAIPLAEHEEASFQRVVSTWLKVARAYTHCAQLDAAQKTTPNLPRIALILQRCLYFTALAINAHYGARRELAPGLWRELHGYYAKAEKWGIAVRAVPGCLDLRGPNIHCASAFLAPLLAELAGPYALSLRDLAWVTHLASHWAALLHLRAAQPKEPLPPFIVDLGQDVGVCAGGEGQRREDFRFLDSTRLVARLKQVKQQLNQGADPDQLGLGSTRSASQCQRLLDALADPWSLTPSHRAFARHNAVGSAQIGVGFPAMHYHISGKEFEQGANVKVYSRQEIEVMLTFRHRVDPASELQIRPEHPEFDLDEWQVINQSAHGFRLMRTNVGKCLTHSQLLSICPHDGERFLLAKSTWLMQEQSGGLVAGVALLPGIPLAIAARPLAQQLGNSEIFSRAFLLPAVSSVGSEASLVLPRGWFSLDRVIEIDSDCGQGNTKTWLARMRRIVDEGVDFERVAFTVAK